MTTYIGAFYRWVMVVPAPLIVLGHAGRPVRPIDIDAIAISGTSRASSQDHHGVTLDVTLRPSLARGSSGMNAAFDPPKAQE
jgi:hypothetical protein